MKSSHLGLQLDSKSDSYVLKYLNKALMMVNTFLPRRRMKTTEGRVDPVWGQELRPPTKVSFKGVRPLTKVSFKGVSTPRCLNPETPNLFFFLASSNLGKRFLLRVLVCNIPWFWNVLKITKKFKTFKCWIEIVSKNQ